MTIQKGDQAPLFKLFSSDKKEVSLEDYKGKNVVLLFFPMAFTGVCTTELCHIRDNYKDFEHLNSEVLGISVDSVFTLDKYKEEEQYNFPLLSDFNKEVSQAYGSYYEHFAFGMKGVSKRSAFVIDKEGTVQYTEVLEDAGKIPDFEAIKQSLAHVNR